MELIGITARMQALSCRYMRNDLSDSPSSDIQTTPSPSPTLSSSSRHACIRVVVCGRDTETLRLEINPLRGVDIHQNGFGHLGHNLVQEILAILPGNRRTVVYNPKSSHSNSRLLGSVGSLEK